LLFAWLAFKEALLGLLVGFLLSLPFWLFQTVGNLINNQCSVSATQINNPSVGNDASLIGGLILQTLIILAFQTNQIDLSLARRSGHFEQALAAATGAALANVCALILPVSCIALLLTVAGNIAQVGFLFTPQAMALKFNKFNPVGNAKQIFSARGLTQFFLICSNPL
jgi:flagellar biosynthesis protein FliR